MDPFVPLVDRSVRWAVLAALLGLFLAGGAPILAQEGTVIPAAPGSVTGRVTDAQGQPLPGIRAILHHYTGAYPDLTAITGSDGIYRIPSVAAGLYHVEFRDPAGVYGFQFYGPATRRSQARAISVTGNDVTGIDATLSPGGAIAGELTAAGWLSATTYLLELYRPLDVSRWELMDSTTLSATTPITYRLDGLAPGGYQLCLLAQDAMLATQAAECYDNRIPSVPRPPSGGDQIVVVAGQTTTIDMTLGDISSLSGSVLAEDGAPLAEINVLVLPHNFPYPFYTTKTDAQGHFQFGYLPPGAYTFAFWDSRMEYAPEYYNNVQALERVTPVEVTQEGGTEIEARLAPAARISGVLRLRGGAPLPSSYVSFSLSRLQDGVPYYWAHPCQAYWLCTSYHYDPATGIYRILGLPAGEYFISASSQLLVEGGAGLVGSLSSPISLQVGEARSGVDIELGAGDFDGGISGVVRAGATPLQGIQVGIYRPGWPSILPARPIAYAVTDAEGRYQLDGLLSGSYAVGFLDPAGVYATSFYTGARQVDMAAPLFIQNTVYTGVDGALVVGGTVRGQVSTVPGTPVPDYQVFAFQETYPGYWQVVFHVGTRTGADGRYALTGLHTGRYRIAFVSPEHIYRGEYPQYPPAPGSPPLLFYGGTPFLDSSPMIEVKAGQVAEDIDLVLNPLHLYLPQIRLKPTAQGSSLPAHLMSESAGLSQP